MPMLTNIYASTYFEIIDNSGGFSLSAVICRRRRKQFFAGKAVLKIKLNRKGLTQGYSTYGGSG